MRSIGYSFNNAIADIVDNSIAANATQINIQCDWAGYEPTLEIKDNGFGMNYDQLEEAMRLGSKSPVEERAKTDLGRFGLGLKTASFSQCKKLTVITKKEEQTFKAVWDLDLVVKENKWIIDIEELKGESPLINDGTIIKWEKIDTFEKKNQQDSEKYFESVVSALDEHIGLVFHRYISGEFGSKISFSINGIESISSDPFFIKKSTKLPTEYIDNCSVTTYTLPHHTKCSSKEWNDHEGKEGYLANQGFYLYRNGRLISKATWFGLSKKLDMRKLCRICIDINNESDLEWQLDVKKSSANPPPRIKRKLRSLIDKLTLPSTKKFTYRSRTLANSERSPIWDRKVEDRKITYKINRNNPLISSLFSSMDDDSALELERTFCLIDKTLPSASIFSDYSEDPKNLVTDEITIKELAISAKKMLEYLTYKDKLSRNDACDILKSMELFRNNWEELKESI